MQIGSVSFPSRPIFLAPMEDVTDIGFRRLCKRFGADMVYTEFVSAEALAFPQLKNLFSSNGIIV